MNTYRGACHCTKVGFQIETDAVYDDIYRCNCSLCKKKAIIMKPVNQTAFTLMQGADFLSSYKWNKHIAEHFFCRVCGIYTHHRRRRNPEQISVNLACLDNIDLPAENLIGFVDGSSHD